MELIVITPLASVVTVVAPVPLIVTESVPLPDPPAVKSKVTLPFDLLLAADKSYVVFVSVFSPGMPNPVISVLVTAVAADTCPVVSTVTLYNPDAFEV